MISREENKRYLKNLINYIRPRLQLPEQEVDVDKVYDNMYTYCANTLGEDRDKCIPFVDRMLHHIFKEGASMINTTAGKPSKSSGLVESWKDINTQYTYTDLKQYSDRFADSVFTRSIEEGMGMEWLASMYNAMELPRECLPFIPMVFIYRNEFFTEAIQDPK